MNIRDSAIAARSDRPALCEPGESPRLLEGKLWALDCLLIEAHLEARYPTRED